VRSSGFVAGGDFVRVNEPIPVSIVADRVVIALVLASDHGALPAVSRVWVPADSPQRQAPPIPSLDLGQPASVTRR
jgi:hypothetical protein